VTARGRAGLALLAGLATLAGCAGSSEEAVLRFSAERARWKIDRLERRSAADAPDSAAFVARVRREHERIAGRYGPEGTLPAGASLDADARVRYRIAGSSALYALDLATRDEVTPEVCAGYADLAKRYDFDPEVVVRARTHEGLARQRRGDVTQALQAFASALEATFPTAASDVAEVPPYELLRADVEVHVALLVSRTQSAAEAAAAAQRGAERLGPKVDAWSGKPGDGWLDRRRGELLALAGRGEEAVQRFEKIVAATAPGEDRSAIALLLGEVEEVALGRNDQAERWYRTAVTEGTGRPIGTDARLLLGHLLRSTGRPREAADILAPAIVPGASTTGEDRAEALYDTARCLEALDRSEDALLAVTRGATEEGPFALGCAARRARRTRDLDSPDSGRESEALVARAAREFGARVKALSLRDYTRQLRVAREDEAWRDVNAELSGVAASRPGTSLADSARTLIGAITGAGLAPP
jgi:hypothetical protein